MNSSQTPPMGVKTQARPGPGFADAEQSQPAAHTPVDALRVLHVEDNPADALLMQEYLRDVLPGVAFDTAERLAELTPDRAAVADCALLDLSLPDASGLDAVIALRAMADNLPIIVLTGFDDLELALSAVRGGADDYLLKSHVDGYSLERAVKYAVERRRLMFEVRSSSFTAQSATAAALVAEAATLTAEESLTNGAAQHALQLADLATNASVDAATAHHKGHQDTATGTHEVSVRIDAGTGEFALRCASCAWESDRGPDVLHSWSDRSLEVALLRHVDFQGTGRAAVTTVASTQPEVSRRRMMRPRSWLPSRSEHSPTSAEVSDSE